jgi:hypothetical protein
VWSVRVETGADHPRHLCQGGGDHEAIRESLDSEYAACFTTPENHVKAFLDRYFALMSFTYNIGIGMTAGFVFYPLFKIAAGKAMQVRPGMWVLGLLSALFYVFYPY